MYNQFKLGKGKVKYDSRTLQFAKYDTELPERPLAEAYSQDVKNWEMMGNDTIGDCTCAAAGHGIMSWTDDNKKLFTPTTSQIIHAYSAVTGYRPGDPNTDNGAACIDVLNYWRKTGVANHKIGAYVQLDPHNSYLVKKAIYLFGLVYIGIALPISAQTQQNWSVWPTGLAGDGAPGTWGGHCVVCVGYDAQGLDVITWGQQIRMSWNFWYAYVDESYAILSTDFVNGTVPAVNGFNLAQLQADLKVI